ncbi:MAG: hypothetical protein Q7K55_04595 [Candidatus Levybacteria bacterium]|nr:hypothetical protein [Candidatus Levybacteria bacterium]
MRVILGTLIIFILLFAFTRKIYSESPYVLPYPSDMPGSVFYKLDLIKENILKYWYFGNFGQFSYNLKMADKYLVEAKTLFEYRQYLLGLQALGKSNLYFKQVYPNLVKAEKANKNIQNNLRIFKEASSKHIEVLNNIKVPEIFVWAPEKAMSTKLYLGNAIGGAVKIRSKNL